MACCGAGAEAKQYAGLSRRKNSRSRQQHALKDRSYVMLKRENLKTIITNIHLVPMAFRAFCQELYMPHLISLSRQLNKVGKVSRVLQTVSAITRISAEEF